MEYYIWSRRHSPNPSEIWFFKPSSSGYTQFLEDAGIYGKEMEGFFKILKTKHAVTRVWNNNKKYQHDDFLIPVDKVEILGPKKTVIGNV